MPKRSRKEDRAKSMPMAVKPSEPLRDFKNLVVRQLIKEGKVIVHKKKNWLLMSLLFYSGSVAV